jgi:hypothetical protein
MAKVTMTIEDTENGEFHVVFEFEPALAKGEGMTPAQGFGAQIVDACAGRGEVLEGFANDDDEEDDSL